MKTVSDRRLSQIVVERIKELIHEKKLVPGDKLPNEMDFTELFSVSRPTIREAVKVLVSQNILEIKRGRGTYLAQNTGVVDDPLGLDFIKGPDLLHSLIEARLTIEPGVARLAALNAHETDIENIVANIHEMEKVVLHKQVEMSIELDFHKSIVQAARNPVLMRIVPFIVDGIIKIYQNFPRTSSEHSIALDEHKCICNAIKKRSPEEAFLAMQRHLENSYDRTFKKGFPQN